MIEIKNLSKTFRIKDGLVKALEDVSLFSKKVKSVDELKELAGKN